MSQTSDGEHANNERTVACPAKGCNAEPLARGYHLHVMRSNDDAHGPQGEVPEHLRIEHAKTAGSRKVSVNYPEERENEKVMRQCPYCRLPFLGKQGLSIHFGQVVGRKNHPKERDEFPEPESCPVVHVDDKQNVVEVVDAESTLPATEQRDGESVAEFIARLRASGEEETADAIEEALAALA